MEVYKSIFAVALLALVAIFQAAPSLASEISLDLSSIAPGDAKTAPPSPKTPELRTVELHPDDNLTIHCPAKKFPGDKGWIEYHSSLSGSGCLISKMTTEANADAYQATKLGSQKIVVGLKQPGSSQIEKDCIITVKVLASVAQTDNKGSSPNVQSFAGQTVFGNKTSAVTNNSIKSFSGSDKNQTSSANQAKPATHSVEDLSKSTVKSY